MQLKTLAASAALALLAGCTSVDLTAPTEDRSTPMVEPSVPIIDGAQTVPVPSEVETPHLVAEPRAVSSGRTHTVVEGDTVYNISKRYGCNPRELMQLNGISDPTQLSLGRTLDIPEERADGRPTVAPSAAAEGTVSDGVVVNTQPEVQVATRPETREQVVAREQAQKQAERDAAARGQISIRWPVSGSVIASFEQTGRLGIDIEGSEGDPVMVVLDGTVQYVGNNAADGYGQFVIVRHNIRLPGKATTPLVTVYGNASKILVRPGESVRAGQKIAEVGNTGADVTKLRFEIRQGQPLDPMLYLVKNNR